LVDDLGLHTLLLVCRSMLECYAVIDRAVIDAGWAWWMGTKLALAVRVRVYAVESLQMLPEELCRVSDVIEVVSESRRCIDSVCIGDVCVYEVDGNEVRGYILVSRLEEILAGMLAGEPIATRIENPIILCLKSRPSAWCGIVPEKGVSIVSEGGEARLKNGFAFSGRVRVARLKLVENLILVRGEGD